MKSDEDFMKRALLLAARARGKTLPNPMVGAVLVRRGKIIQEGWHRRAGEEHAERKVLLKAGTAARGATLFVTLEPCCHFGKTPPCTDIILESGVARVVVAARDPFPLVSGKGIKILRRAGLDVKTGVLEQESRRLNEAFFTYHEKKRPFITIKWAMSMDGRTSTDTGSSMWITGPEARRYSHRLRGFHAAVSVGIGTILVDNPRLSVRSTPCIRQPDCVIIDPELRTPPWAAVLQESHRVFIACGSLSSPQRSRRASLLKSVGAIILPLKERSGEIPIRLLLKKLHEKGIQSLYIEGGRKLAGRFLRTGMVDKFALFMAPRIIGGIGVTSPLVFQGPDTIKDCPEIRIVRSRRFGRDYYFEAYPV